MTRRIAIKTLLAPSGIYQPRPVAVSGYRPTPESRFAVVRLSNSDAWRLTHVKSGGSLDSIFLCRWGKVTMTQKLAVAAAFEAAADLDWSAFDALPEITPETTEPPAWARQPSPATIERIRKIAAQALGVGQ